MTTRHPQDQRALELLWPFADRIAGGSNRHAPVAFYPATWERWLEGSPVAAPVAPVLADLDGFVDRVDLRRYAREATTEEGRFRLFVATLVWGRGRSNGRMRHHLVRALEHHDEDGTTLADTSRLAQHGRPREAYDAWAGPGLGPAFFTKWLWASSLAHKPSRRPLILDSRVWRSLNCALDWSSLDATTSRSWPHRYQGYVDSAHLWAAQLSTGGRKVSAEDVEWALFSAAGELSLIPSVENDADDS